MQPTTEWPLFLPVPPLSPSLSRFKLTLHCPLSPGLALSLSHSLLLDSFGVAVAVGVEIIQLAISYLFASLLCCSPSSTVALSLFLSSPHRSLGSSSSCHFRCVPDNRTAENSLFAIAAHLCRKSVGHVRRRTRGRVDNEQGGGREVGCRVLGVVNVSMNEGQFETTALALTYSFARSFDLIV